MPVNLFKLSGEVDVNTGKAEANLKRIERDAKRTQTVLGQTETSGKRAGSGIASGFNQGTSSAGRLLREISQLHSKLGSLKAPSLNFGSAGGSGGMLGGIKSIVGGNLISGAISSALGGITDGLKEGWSAGIEYNKMLEKANISFTTLLGSTAKAQEHLKALQAFGEATPFEFPDLIKASQRMQAMGFTAKDIIPTLKNIGDAVSAIGGGKDELDGVVLALGQMQTKGKVSAEEMNQLAERGIPAWDLLAQAIGKTKAETIKLSEAGRLNGGRAVQGITAMMGERFGGQMTKMSGTLEGQESNFQDILNRQLGTATQGNFEQLKNAYAKGTAGFTSGAATKFTGEVNQLLTDMGKGFAPIMEKFASGEYFMQGFDAAVLGRKASDAFDKGETGKGMNLTGQAVGRGIGLEYGAKGEDKTASAIADGLKAKPIFSEGIDRTLIQGITGAMQKVEVAAKAAGALVGIGTGEGIETGVRDQLDMHSPSRVMEGLGQMASVSFGTGFNNGLNEVINRTSDGIKKWAKAIENAGGEEFLKAVEEMAKRLQVDPNKIMNVMAFESGFNPAKKNPNSSATGLIQFMDATASGMGTSTDNLKVMSAIEQLKYVEEYFKQFKKMADTQEAVYTAVLAGRPVSDPNSTLFAKGGKTNRAYLANSALDKDKSGTITAAEAAAQTYKQGFLSAGDGAKEAAGLFDQLSIALDGVKARLSSLTDSALQFVGYGTAAPVSAATIPKPPAIQQAQAQTVQGGQLATSTTTAKADILTLSKDAAAATVQMSVPLKDIAPTATTATEALKSTASQAGAFADAITEAGSATKEAIDHLSHFKDAFASGFDNMFDDILDGKKVSMKDFGKQLFKGGLSSIISSATGGQASSPGGMLSNMLFGGKGGGMAGAGGGGSFPSTGGFAGGGGAGSILSGGGSGGGGIGGAVDMAQGIGGSLSKMPAMAKVGGFLKGLPGIGGAIGKIGGMLGMGGGMAGAGGAAAGAAGAASGAAGAAGGAMGAMSGVMAAAGPIGMIASMAIPFMQMMSKSKIGRILSPGGALIHAFTHDYEADFKKLIKSEYGISASKQMIAKVMQIGQSKYGPEDWKKRQIETVRLPEVRDMLSEYSGAFMKGGNAKLFNSAEYGDQFSAVNQFKVGMRANGGPVMAGQPYIVGERRAELFVPNSNGRIMPSVDGHGGGGMFGKGKEEILAILAKVAESLDRFQSMPADHVVMTGLKARPGMAAADVVNSFTTRDEHSQKIRQMNATR